MDRAPFFCRPRAGPPTKIAPDLSLRPLVRSSRRFPLEDHLPPFLDQGIKRRLQSRFGEGRKSYNLSSVRTHNGSVFRTSSFSPFARMGKVKIYISESPLSFFSLPSCGGEREPTGRFSFALLRCRAAARGFRLIKPSLRGQYLAKVILLLLLRRHRRRLKS